MRYVRPLFLIALATQVIYFSSCSQFEEISDSEVLATKKYCDDLVTPESFHYIRERSILKDNLVVYTTEYDSSDDPKRIAEHFSAFLTKNGWEYSPYSAGSTKYLVFVNGKYKIVIEYEDSEAGTSKRYGLSCSWGLPR